jgi:hypothetical protein
MIGEVVEARLYADHVEIWYGQREVDRFPRLRGKGKHRIHYRHLIEWLVRKPGAFDNYRYREDLFPSSHFRMAYDYLMANLGTKGVKEYLKVLHLAFKESEERVEEAIRSLIRHGLPVGYDAVEVLAKQGQGPVGPPGPGLGRRPGSI